MANNWPRKKEKRQEKREEDILWDQEEVREDRDGVVKWLQNQ